MTTPQQPGSGRLPLVALVAALLVGPVGVALGIAALRQQSRTQPGRGLAIAAIVVGAVQTVVVGWALIAGGAGAGPASNPSPAATSTYPSTPPPSGPVLEPSESPTPKEAKAENLGEFIVPGVDSYDWAVGGADDEEKAAGAVDAEQGTYTAKDELINAAMAEWPTVEQARERAQHNAETEAAAQGWRLVSDGQLGRGAGYFWYYEKDGVGSVFWHYGKFSAHFTGSPNEVQEFFLRFPK